jgi:archaeal flagellar protein FlaJ
MNIVSFAYNIFGDTVKRFRFYFMDVREDLQKANMGYTLEEWLSLSLFLGSITFVAEVVVFAFIFGIMGINPIMAIFLSLMLSLAIVGGLFFLFYSYPTTLAKGRESRIKKVLPFAVSYLAAIASSNASPIFFFKTLGNFKEYGEVSRDSQSIVRDVEVFGMSLYTSIKRHAQRTPSKDFRELLWGINTMYSSGGNISEYLNQKSNELMSEYRRRIKKYAQDLSLFVEIYLTLIIVGAIFFIILSSIISAITAGLDTVIIQTFIVFILLPLMSTGFIILVRSISPTN